MRLIDADALIEDLEAAKANNGMGGMVASALVRYVKRCSTIDAVPVEQYNDLREAFVDFVCSGVHNPGPYCKNKCAECVDGYGWCTYRRCNGFNPDGKRRSDA